MRIKVLLMVLHQAYFKADVSKLQIDIYPSYFVSILDLDPCTNVTCEYHSHCIALAPHQYACVCEDNCPSYEEQVCASNGRTFDNLCLLQLEICLTRANYTAYHPGSCTGTWHANYSGILRSTVGQLLFSVKLEGVVSRTNARKASNLAMVKDCPK